MTSPWKISEGAANKRAEDLAKESTDEDKLAIDIHAFISVIAPEYETAVLAVTKVLASYLSILPATGREKTLEMVMRSIKAYISLVSEVKK